MAATIATSSMITLAGSERVAGELTISGKNFNGETPFVKINGEAAQNGRSIFSSSTIVTPENVGAVINLGKIGKIELSPNTNLTLSFNEKSITGNLLAGQVTVLNAAETVTIKTIDGTTSNLAAGESAVSTIGKAQDDDASSDGGSGWIIWALVLGGAAAGIVIAATSNNNRITVGGNSTVISPTR
ncbi:MAG: hypothetical protein LH614_05740 [Pyrinomonadaceae bacterium]|nr:hypothetical protein [Pyrinomonadaceae bacterium]